MPELTAEGYTLKDAFKKCKANFKALNNEELYKWICQAKDKERPYIAELNMFKIDFPVEKIFRKKILTEDQEKIKEKMECKPEMPPTSGYN